MADQMPHDWDCICFLCTTATGLEVRPEPSEGVLYRERKPTLADYDEALAELRAAREQVASMRRGEAQPECGVCGDNDHTAEACHHNPLVMARAGVVAQQAFRCFHCGEVFTDNDAAREHFGKSEDEVARCLAARLTSSGLPAEDAPSNRADDPVWKAYRSGYLAASTGPIEPDYAEAESRASAYVDARRAARPQSSPPAAGPTQENDDA